jgi:hypothetical protein
MLTFLMKTQKVDMLCIQLSEDQHQMIQKFKRALRRDKPNMKLLHDLVYSFSVPPSQDAPITKWSNPLWCYIAISSVQVNGTMDPVERMTGKFTIWEYIIRSSTLYEITKDPRLTVRQRER